MKTLSFRLIKNATANLIRGGASAAVALALPHFLTRSLSVEKFAAWSLILQIAAYAGYLDFGVQTAIARHLSQAVEGGDEDRAHQIVNASFLMLSGAGIFAMIVMGLVLWGQNLLFNGIPVALIDEFRRATLIMGIGAAVQLPLSTFTGVLVGLQRNELPAIVIGSTRIGGAVAVILAARSTDSLAVLIAIIAGMNLLGGLIQVFMAGRLMPQLRIRIARVRRAVVREISGYCAGLTVWAFAMLVISGLDVTIVAHVQFDAVGYYSIAALLISFLSGLNGSAFAALLAPLAVLHARKEKSSISEVIVYATRINTLLNLVLMAILFVGGKTLVRIWCGAAYADAATPIVRILLVAQTLRLAMSAYSIGLVSTGEQNRTFAPVILEALVNLGFSIAGALRLGPVGVAWGTLMGAIAGCLWLIFKTMPASSAIPLTPGYFLRSGIVPPLLDSFPVLAFSVWALNSAGSPGFKAFFFLLTLVLSGALFRKRFIRRDFRLAPHRAHEVLHDDQETYSQAP